MKKNLLIAIVLLLPIFLKAQDDGKKFGIKFHGFVKTDIFYDSRQSVAVREGHFYLYPKPEVLDKDGNDINANPNFNILSIQTRLKGIITGPDVLGAKTSALIEAAFFGHTGPDINGFRLRHAFAKLDWTNTQLLVGQYWHPMFITECFPGTVSFNTGAPFQPFTRNPQIRVTQKMGDVSFALSAISQRDFVDNGPAGGSSIYLRNNVIPELNLTIKYHKKNENGNEFLFGISGNYKSLKPRLESEVTDGNKTVIYETDEKVGGFSSMAFMKVKIPKFTFKVEGVYGQSTYSMTMLGGYGAHQWTNEAKGFYDYTPLDVISFWTDIHTNGKAWQFGIFAGYTKNNGSNKTVMNPIYARGYDAKTSSYIDYVYRVSPRVIYNVGKMRFAGEIEYTTAAYGKSIDDKALVQSAEEVTNIRFLIGVYYFF